MTDNEIIKAVECCGKYGGCWECPLSNKAPGSELCITRLAICALDLINRQKAKIEELSEVLSDHIRMNRNEIRAEAIREFVEQHKEIMRAFLYSDSMDFLMKWCEYEANTDNLLREMVGADDG